MPPSWLFDAVKSHKREVRSPAPSRTDSNTSVDVSHSPPAALEPHPQAQISQYVPVPEQRSEVVYSSESGFSKGTSKGTSPVDARCDSDALRKQPHVAEVLGPRPSNPSSIEASTAESSALQDSVRPDLSEIERLYDQNRTLDDGLGGGATTAPKAGPSSSTQSRRDSNLAVPLASERRNAISSFFSALQRRQDERRSESLASMTTNVLAGSALADNRSRPLNPFLAGDTRRVHTFSSSPIGDFESSAPPPLTVLSCEVCATPTFQLCGGCQLLGYCNREHQEKDWPRHSEECQTWADYYSDIAAGKMVQMNATDDQDEDGDWNASSNPPSDEKDKPDIYSRYQNPLDARKEPGAIFEVDAILLPVDGASPEIVKATFQAVSVHPDTFGPIAHRELCFDRLLGKIAPWMIDAQWDEDVLQLSPSGQSFFKLGLMSSCFSLHCRPNGRPNAAYIAVAGKDVTRQSAVAKVDIPVWGDMGPLKEYKHLLGNGNFLVLKHPPTCCPEVAGMLVDDASLDDIQQLVPYLQQRRHYMSSTGGVKQKNNVCKPRI